MSKAKITKPIQDVTYYVIQGLDFGYPPCCINEFIYHSIHGTYEIREKRKFNGTGYVPCKECNKKSKRSLLSYISHNRMHTLPFPQQEE